MGEKKVSKNDKDTRCRAWTFVQYDESSPENWRDIIDNMHIEWVESPLHDKDINGDGTPKKPHRHIMLLFSGVKSYEQVAELIKPLNVPSPQKVHNSKSLVRYMAHLDNPEKHRYDYKDIIAHGGADLDEFFRPAYSERLSCIKEMLAFVKDNGIIEYQDLMDYAMVEHFDDWFPLLCDNSSYVVCNYIKSCRHRDKRKMDFSTGEIV